MYECPGTRRNICIYFEMKQVFHLDDKFNLILHKFPILKLNTRTNGKIYNKEEQQRLNVLTNAPQIFILKLLFCRRHRCSLSNIKSKQQMR